jgi:hypothetical protein
MGRQLRQTVNGGNRADEVRSIRPLPYRDHHLSYGARRLVAPSALLRPQLMNTPSLIFLRIRRLKLLQQLLERIIIAVKPSSQLSELTLSRLLNRFHLTYLLLIKNPIYFRLMQK